MSVGLPSALGGDAVAVVTPPTALVVVVGPPGAPLPPAELLVPLLAALLEVLEERGGDRGALRRFTLERMWRDDGPPR